jgi:hypothetical protein
MPKFNCLYEVYTWAGVVKKSVRKLKGENIEMSL